MKTSGESTAQKLLNAFEQFSRSKWYQKPLKAYKSSEVIILFCIKRGTATSKEGMKVSEISNDLQVTSPTVTQLVKRLEANGWVERRMDPDDRRAVRIKLTEQGEKVAKEAGEAFLASFKGLVDYLGEEESDHFAELLLKVFYYFSGKPDNQGIGSAGEGDEKV